MLPFVLFDDVHTAEAFILQDLAIDQLLRSQDLSKLDAFLQQGWQRNWHVAILADYEFGWELQKLPEKEEGYLHLLWFKTKTKLNDVELWLENNGGCVPAGISEPQWDTSENEYCQAIEQIHAAIKRGDCYQINYTLRLNLNAYGSPIKLYRRLRQNVPYGVLACLPGQNNQDENWVLCFSPELFLQINENGVVRAEPMKGTAPILDDGRDEYRAHILQNDPKNRAENTMIVDLLRNDLGKLAQIGAVHVPEPFKVRPFGAVWQMTTVVEAQMPASIRVADLLAATFPCGSITGAPKRKSMEFIDQLEKSARGLYTGSIGFLEYSPTSALGFTGCLNVVIRTLVLINDKKTGFYKGKYGVGSGIVIDSVAADEYAECHWKSRFLCELRPELGLFETMRVENKKIIWLDRHLSRLQKSAKALNIPIDLEKIILEIHEILKYIPTLDPYRLRMDVNALGKVDFHFDQLLPIDDVVKVMISELVLPVCDPLRRYKTTYRAQYDAAIQQAQAHGAFDALLFNEQGLLLEGGRSSVIILLSGQWLVPKLTSDILDSLSRRDVLERGLVQEADITRQMLIDAEDIQVGNALRGWIKAQLL